jgi:DNA repair exonuclease SbcCD ATPase subunit
MFEKIKTELNQIDDIKKQLLSNNELESQIKEKLNLINNDLQKKDNNYREIELKLKQFLDFENKQKDSAKVKIDLNEINEALLKIKYNPEEYTKIKEQLQKILTEQQYKKQIVLEKEKQIQEEKFKLAQFEQLFKNKDSAENETKILNRYIEDFNIFGQVSKKTQEQVRSYVIESINLVFQDLWQHIYPYKDFNSIKFNADNGDYKIELYFNNEYKRELDEFISGGERSSIALALRIAMCLVMKNKLNLIILDEPTHNLDNATVLQLSDLFNNYLPQFTDQTFVITHDNTLEQYANNVYYISRNKETDGATEIRVK